MRTNSSDSMTNNEAAFEKLVESIQQLNGMLSEDLERRAAGLYRAMFRHEMDVNKLDYHYADHILDYVGSGIDGAVEDYRNYLQYLKCFNTEEYLAHKQMLEDELNPKCEESDEDGV